MNNEFTEEQKQYLQGFAAGTGIAGKKPGVPTFAGTLGLGPDQLPGAGTPDAPRPSEQLCYSAQNHRLAGGKKLCSEEQAKRKIFPLDQWNDVVHHAEQAIPPKGTDVLAFKYFGLFWVAPAQDSFMSRLRFAGGIVKSYQLKGVADLADQYGGGFTDITTRANLQVREIKPADTSAFLEGLYDLGIVNRGSGADNIRNITASPLAGIDPIELYDTRALSNALHHHILNNRDMFGLPRKFNIAFDGGGKIASLEDTNDIGFAAVKLLNPVENHDVAFRLTLGGITGHKDFARDTGVLVLPNECISISHAIIKAFIEHGDRTDRKKARLKYVLDRLGFEGFIKEVEKYLGKPLRKIPLDQSTQRPVIDKHGHIGWHHQKQNNLSHVGILVPVGRMTSDQMRGLAKISDQYGSGTIRLTVWQNLIISDIPVLRQAEVDAAIKAIGLTSSASSVRGGLVACTGNLGCKFANSNTKKHAMDIAEYLDERIELDQPVNIHVTGCPHSCAQHYIGDIGLLGTKVSVGEEMLEGYHLYIGGGYGKDQAIGRELQRNIISTDVPIVIERLLGAYLQKRIENETFNAFVRRHEIAEMQLMINPVEVGI